MKCRERLSRNLGRVEPYILGLWAPAVSLCCLWLILLSCRVCEINAPIFPELNWFLWLTAKRTGQLSGLLCLLYLYQPPFSVYMSKGIWEFPGFEIRVFTPTAYHKEIVNEMIVERTSGPWWVSGSVLSPFAAHNKELLRHFFIFKERKESVSVKLATPLNLCIYNVYISGIQGFGILCPLLLYRTLFMFKNIYKMQFWKHPFFLV